MAKNGDIPISGGLDVAIPKMATVRQRFDDAHIKDVEKSVHKLITRPEVAARVHSGMEIAVGAGSRGIAKIGICLCYTSDADDEG
mgnify:CR=1 FL=1